MKKIISLILAFIMLFGFAACSKNETPEASAAETVTPERGTVENGIYNNAAFGVTFSAGENWYFLTDDEIAMTMGIAAEEMFGEGTEVESGHIYDVYCVDNATNATVSVNYEDLGTIGGMTDANEYLETVMTTLISAGANSGVSDVIITNLEVGGNEYPCLKIVLEQGDIVIYERMIVKQVGSWMATVTMASLSEEELETLIGKLSFE